MTDRFRVVIAGGGVAGLEALLALRDLADDRLEVTLLSPDADFVFRPPAVGAPFGRGRAERRPLAATAHEFGARFVRGELTDVDDADRRAAVDTGERLTFDALLVAVGALSISPLHSVTAWTPDNDPEVFGGLLRDLEEGYAKHVAFVIPPGAAWPLPAYELALMTAWQVSGMGQDDVEVTVYTPEDGPLAMFGAEASDALRRELDEVGIRVQTRVSAREDADGLVLGADERTLTEARVVTLPVPAGRRIGGLPADDRGFIPCDAHGKVLGAEAVWAAGDATAYPVKQGGLAAQQADAAAEAIAAAAGCALEPRPFRPVLRGVVLTGRGRQWMRSDPDDGVSTVSRDYSDLDRRALWWPPTKVAGRYLSPFLAAGNSTDADLPSGHPVELDLSR